MKRIGETAYLAETRTSASALALYREIESAGLSGVDEIVPGAASVLVVFDEPPDEATAARLHGLATRTRVSIDDAPSGAVREISVRYDGPDLADVAAAAGLPIDEVIGLHTSATYRVAFLGFQPGFAYLSGLPEALVTPRRQSPRACIPKGSVAIGGEWSGVYPAASPGGWNLLGTSDIELFDAAADPPCLLTPGDRVRFVRR